MPISEAKLLANRKNALMSTGPKTPEGKARSRQNALKHGLTGSGVALPSEDQSEIAERFTDLQLQMKPKTDAGEQLLRRLAFLTVRIGRCERHETSQTAMRVRHAIEKFDDERLAFVESLATKIYTEPSTSFRRLQMSPEGIDWMLDEWKTLRMDLLNPDRNCWTGNHRMHFDALLGRNPGGYRTARTMALSYAMDGSFHLLDKADGEGLEGPARAAWAKDELTRQIDAEMTRLKEVRAGIDVEAIAMDRAEAADRALFDPSPEAILGASMRRPRNEPCTGPSRSSGWLRPRAWRRNSSIARSKKSSRWVPIPRSPRNQHSRPIWPRQASISPLHP